MKFYKVRDVLSTATAVAFGYVSRTVDLMDMYQFLADAASILIQVLG